MAKILLTYDSGYGATARVAKIIAESFRWKGCEIDLHHVGSDDPFSGDISRYDAAVVGGPIRLSRCTPKIRTFVTANLAGLTSLPVAFFFTCMSATGHEGEDRFRLFIDPSFNDPAKPDARIRMMENNHAVSYYLKHFLKLIPGVKPLSISFFKGSLNTEKLNLFHRMIMRFAMFALPEIRNGDFVNPTVVQSWAVSLVPLLHRRHSAAH